jgi:hypothetical protein
MRFLFLVRAASGAEADPAPAPDAAMLQAMRAFHEELARAGVLLDRSGLAPGREGWRVHLGPQGRRIVEGPFTDDPALAGYTLIQVRSREEALEWSRRHPHPFGAGREAVIEVRRLHEPGDPAFPATP